MDRTAPLSQTQRMALLNLIKERDSIVNNKSTAPGIIEAKKRTWEEIVLKFNALNPDQQPRSSKQLKRSYDHVKRKVKDEDREFKKKIKVTGGGCPPTPPKAMEEIALAASMMTVDLAMGNDVFETFNVEPVHNSSAADVYELQEEVVDDPGVPGIESYMPILLAVGGSNAIQTLRIDSNTVSVWDKAFQLAVTSLRHNSTLRTLSLAHWTFDLQTQLHPSHTLSRTLDLRLAGQTSGNTVFTRPPHPLQTDRPQLDPVYF
ncbi:hypothetical protein Pcinc_005949 [Petrolisthes cinctipes]|uniref:Regulatory protein zeste n=2 Tax=Petrolisthes cinctipes TaxID=88211 RepID=A0AAE1KYT1_PETCI|nr:hypothetical protein Pcinc_005949 [Petrolisthes cinctipes]